MFEPDRRLAEAARLHEARRLGEAETILRALLAEADACGRSRPPPVLARLAGVLLDRGDPERAYTIADEAAALAPADPLAHNLRAMALATLGRLAEADRALSTALELDPSRAELHHNRGRILAGAGRHEAAIASFRRALEIEPTLAAARAAVVPLLRHAGRFGEALELLDAMDAAERERPGMLAERGLLLYQLRRPAEALAVLDRAIAADPAAEAPRMHRAHALLLMGDYARGWPAHDFLYHRPSRRPPPFDRPRWTGQDVAGRTVVVWNDLGFGDAIQFVRYVPRLAARGATVVLLVQRPLVRLLASVAGAARVAAIGEPIGAHDFHVELMALPTAFRARLDDVAAPLPYLAPDRAIRERWAARFPTGSRPRVGLVWAGEPRPHLPLAHAADRRRSIPLAALAPLAAVEGVDLVSLQLGEARAERAAVPFAARIDDPMDGVADFADTAAIVERLDLVVSVCTAAAHLVGALGRPGLVLLCFDACWRWLHQREDSPWHPTLRLLRQPAPGEWAAPVARAASAVADLASARARA
ncbi:MAG: tetratricopeptide repeat protein [Alphaproteobacteria bacterium]